MNACKVGLCRTCRCVCVCVYVYACKIGLCGTCVGVCVCECEHKRLANGAGVGVCAQVLIKHVSSVRILRGSGLCSESVL